MARLIILVLFTVIKLLKLNCTFLFIITQDISKSPIAAEQQEDIANSDAACCDDVDDNVLSDEALDKLDKELEEESSDEKELGVNRTGAVVNGTDEEEIHEVVSY